MSYVCNVVLLMSCAESVELADGTDVLPALERLNEWLKENAEGRAQLVRVDQHNRNSKSMECYVAIGAFNYLDVDGFMNAFRDAGWDSPETVQLLFRGQDDEVFREHRAATD